MTDLDLGAFIIKNVSNVLVAVVGYFLVRSINRLDATLDRVVAKQDDHERRVSTLEGARSVERNAWTPPRNFLFAVAFLCFAAVARAQTPTPATFNPIPQQNASFFSSLYTFLLNESPDRDATWQGNYKLTSTGCIHPTVAGTTGTFSTTCTAMVGGYYTVEPATAINYTTLGATATDFCWVILTVDTTTAISGFTRLPGTHYMGNCTAADTSRPALGTDNAMYVMGTTLTGGSITAVLDAASQTPGLWRYTDSSEIEHVAGRLWLGDFGGYCLSDAGGSCTFIPSGDSGSCAVCGDSASTFFAAGQLETARGGTGLDTSASVGVPRIGPTPGSWSAMARVTPQVGGTGLDTSASVGVPIVGPTPGKWVVNSFPNRTIRQNAALWSPDGTQCTKTENNGTFIASVLGETVACASSSSGRFGTVLTLPTSYTANSAITFTLTGVNSGTIAGVLAFNLTCLCVSDGEQIDIGNYAVAVPLNLTFAATSGDNQIQAASITCGGTCTAGDALYWRATVNTGSTTHSTPTQLKLGEMALTISTSALGD